jgi:hypothetical protein
MFKNLACARRLAPVAALLFASALGLASVAAAADHPGYLHALTDLRTARAHLQNPDSGVLHDEERNAVAEIDKAIAEIKAASIDDGKNLNDHPGIDVHLKWVAHLNKCAELLKKAHDDVAKEEDNPEAQGLQGRALDHIAKASRFVQQAIALEQ